MTTSTWEDEDDINEQQMLQCVVEVAKAAFRAEASSVFLVDDQTGDLVFEAVAGRGHDHLIGTRFNEGTGIAGWVAACGQPMLVDSLEETPFSHDAAQRTGYVPRNIAAAPLFVNDRCIGVLEVLDRTIDGDELAAQELLGLLASQAAVGLELLKRLRHRRHRDGQRNPAPEETAATMHRIASRLATLNAREARLLSDVLAFAHDITDPADAPGAPSG